MKNSSDSGLTFIEVLLVIAILAILFLIVIVRVRSLSQRSQDVRVRNDVRQLRLLAEQVYDEEGAVYLDWAAHPDVVDGVVVLRNDIDDVHGNFPGEPWESVIIDEREKEYCISAPLVVTDVGKYYCTDTSGEFSLTDSQCALPGSPSTPLKCPGS